MKPGHFYALTTFTVLPVVLLGVGVGGLLTVRGTDEGRTTEVTVPSSKPAPPGPVLPVVTRPPAVQPPVGLSADAYLDTKPPRKTKSLDLVKNGWTYNCMECHKLLQARWHYDRPLNEHQNIKLEHGNNRFCLNCHHATNRNAFVDYDGSEIAQADVVLLCAKCHGTTHRDWEAGVHGRVNGFWNADMGGKTRLRCIQCHDPHHPKMPTMKPLPPPRYPARAVKSDGAATQSHNTQPFHSNSSPAGAAVKPHTP